MIGIVLVTHGRLATEFLAALEHVVGPQKHIAAIDRRGNRIAAAAGRLHALSPVATLARGYAIARDGQGSTLASIDSFVAGMKFELRVRDGIVQSTANAIVRREGSVDVRLGGDLTD